MNILISVAENKLTHTWKSIHKGPVVKIIFLNGNVLMASGGSDGAVRLWNVPQRTCTHNLKGVQGVIRYGDMYRIKY